MTDKEKARAYDEALEKAQCWLNDPQTIQDCNYTIEDAIQNIFPVLAKNEDEMIRKELINWINGKTTYEWSYEWCENKDRWIAYLEKLKEANKAIEAVERIDKYIDEHLANAHDMKDSNPDKKYYRGWDDALGKIAGILQDVYSGEKQKEQKPAEWSKEDEYLLDSIEEAIHSYYDLNHAPQYDYWLEEKLKSLRLQPKEEWSKEDEEIFNNIIEKAKGGHWIQMDEIVWLIARFKSLRSQPKPEWSEEDEKTINDACCWIAEYAGYLMDKNYGKASMLMGLTDKLKSLRPQPKVEWGEEEQKIYDDIISALEKSLNANRCYFTSDDVKFLKLLRPSWKPSEEQMKAFKKYIEEFQARAEAAVGGWNNFDVMIQLYEQLKKL